MAESCRFAFAVHVMAVLATRPGEFCPSTMLARTVNTNPVVIRRLLLDLQGSGLVEVHRGPAGGACLKLKPGQITLRDIYRAVENTRLFGRHPGKPSQRCPVGSRIASVLAELFERAAKAMEQELQGITLTMVIKKMGR